MYPVIRVHGDARERGRQYGQQARDRVHRSISAYRTVFQHYATWDWPTVLAEARRFHEPIRAFGTDYYEELLGIAEGAGVDVDEVIAINVRTEVMFAAKARASGASLPRVGECSSFAMVGGGGTMVGQNWDWLPHAFDTTVVLEVDPASGPRFVTVVEAGLLAKTGFNAAGLGLCTNALVSSSDIGAPGVPYHVLLRALLDATTPTEALATIQRRERSSSANYLIAHDSGLALDVEASPGDFSRLYLLDPDASGRLVHTNHFISPAFPGPDVGLWVMPDSPFRLQRIRAAVGALDQPDAAGVTAALTDHAGHPYGVCCHPDPEVPDTEQGATVASLVMDLANRTLRLASGNPCQVGYDVLDYADFLAHPATPSRDRVDASVI
jgi:isopenicillin-N N-acyltransferase-like protein